MNIEVEVRSFISEEKFQELLDFFEKEAKFIEKVYQETFYFDSEADLRIQRNDSSSKIWLKKGKIHAKHREEIEIEVNKDQFEELEQLFLALGYNVEIKWYRKRHKFKWGDTTVCLDFTEGYGHIIELEKICSKGNEEDIYEGLREKLRSLDVDITPKEEFDKRYRYYKENWRSLTD